MEADRAAPPDGPGEPAATGPAAFRRPLAAAAWIAVVLGAALWPLAQRLLAARPS